MRVCTGIRAIMAEPKQRDEGQIGKTVSHGGRDAPTFLAGHNYGGAKLGTSKWY